MFDLADPVSVESFVKRELADGRPLDLLINNAGIMALPRREVSPDGHELQFATNVWGGALVRTLTKWLKKFATLKHTSSRIAAGTWRVPARREYARLARISVPPNDVTRQTLDRCIDELVAIRMAKAIEFAHQHERGV